MANIYLKSVRGRNYDLTRDCCAEMLRSGSFTWKTVPCVPMRLKNLYVRGIVERVPGTSYPYVYVCPLATMKWYHEQIEEENEN